MSVLFTSTPERGEVFSRLFAEEMPDLPFFFNAAPVPEDVEYLIAWTCPDNAAETYPNLRMVFSVGAGVDQLDLTALPPQVDVVRMLEPGIPQQMREYVTMATLALHRDLAGYLRQQQQGVWKAGRNRPAQNRRIGVMGLGQLGQAVLDALAPFGFELAGWSRTDRDLQGVDTYTDLPGFLARTDILICLLPLTPETTGILNEELLRALPRGAALIHVGRGRHLDHDALLRVLDEGHLSGAWLDVTAPEPLPSDHPFWTHPKITLTPHVACQARAEDGARHVLSGIRADRTGKPVPGLIDRTRGY